MDFDIAVFGEASQITGALRFDTSREEDEEGDDGWRSVRPLAFVLKKKSDSPCCINSDQGRPTRIRHLPLGASLIPA